ncbi:MAG: PASTA domain-containing protein [Alloprevotella sp.]|nr:PASTA domain-containing protein [Bacteroidales bacterium]MBR1653231.1 PASTA domain-containing protein [Alloprevotella sp.]
MPRYFVIAAMLTLCGVAILGRATYLIAYDKDYWLEVDSINVKKDLNPEYPVRGDILADNGEVLASSVPEYNLCFDFRSYEKDPVMLRRDKFRRYLTIMLNLDTICRGLHEVFPDIDTVKLQEHIIEGYHKQSAAWKVYPRRVTYIEYSKLLQQPFFNKSPRSKGFYGGKFEVRKKPFGSLAGRFVGDLEIQGQQNKGRTGLELKLDGVLRGQMGWSHRTKVLDSMVEEMDKQPENGWNVETTLNVTMQEICEKTLREHLEEYQAAEGGVEFGLCILMEVATGDVKAISSLTNKDGKFLDINDQAITYRTEPGSVFKPMSFLIAFDEGYLHMDDLVNVGNGRKKFYGREMTDHNVGSGGYGTLTAEMCIANSSNIGVATFIDRFYSSNPQHFVDKLHEIGVGEDLQVPIPNYRKPRIKAPNSLLEGEYWAKTDLPWMSYGYVTQLAPINTLTFYNGIANNGRMMRPRFIKAYTQNGEVMEEFPPVVLRERMAQHDEAIKNIQQCLRSVVVKGVGKRYNSRKIHIAGKTGTAVDYSGGRRNNTRFVSFAGYFPYESPKYSCIVCVKKNVPAAGGRHCEPIFVEIAETVLAQELQRSYQTAKDSVHTATPFVSNGDIKAAGEVLSNMNISFQRDEIPSGNAWGVAEVRGQSISLRQSDLAGNIMPDMKGYGLRDAVYRLEKMGLKVKCIGAGHVVGQSMKPGQTVTAGEKVVLTLAHGKAENRTVTDSLQHVAETAAQAEAAQAGTQRDDSTAVNNGTEKKPAPKKKPEEKQKATPSSENRTSATNKNKKS